MNDIELLKFHLKLKKEQWITITDGSMMPTLYAKNQIKIKSADKYNLGDIIIFPRQQHLVIHRIVYVSDKTMYFKGDNNKYIDNDSQSDKIIGKVKNESIFSRMIASLSYSNSIKKKSTINGLILKLLCYCERYLMIIAHNLKVKIK